MNNYEYTKLYYSHWLGADVSVFENPGITLVKSESRKVRQEGYPANFEVYCLKTGGKLFVSYNPELDAACGFHDVLAGTHCPEDALNELDKMFPGRVHHRKVFYYTSLPPDIEFRDAVMLTKEDYCHYRRFFTAQNPHLSPDGWMEDYFGYLTENKLCFGIFKDGKLVSVTDSPFVPYIPDIITEPGINTLEEYRRKGYAKAVCAAFIKSATDRGKVPIWSCRHSNLASARLAESLGYLEFAELFTVEGKKGNEYDDY